MSSQITLAESSIEEQIARVRFNSNPATAGKSAETLATIERVQKSWTEAGGFHARPASKDAGPQPRSATEARILYNTGRLKQPYTEETKRLLAEAGCSTEKSPELVRILANANPSALTDAERALALPQSAELTRVLANTAGLAGRRKD